MRSPDREASGAIAFVGIVEVLADEGGVCARTHLAYRPIGISIRRQGAKR